MSSNIQVLMHAGELQQIAQIITYQKNKLVRGCLFGLWRNSLKQPVIQFLTGPGVKNRRDPMDDEYDEYDKYCTLFMREHHALLKLGYWYSGSAEENPDALKDLGKNDCTLLLFINVNGRELSGNFQIVKNGVRSEGSLCNEDILPGDSSFRLYENLTTELKKGAMYKLNSEDCKDLSSSIAKLPSRTEVRDPETKKEQWYSSDAGVNLLQSMFQYLQSKSFEVEMSRDASTHNFQFNLNTVYCLDFPSDFPHSMPVLSDSRVEERWWQLQFRTGSTDEICEGLVDALRNFTRSQQKNRKGYSN